jgi:prophage regulatory protein
MTYTRNQKSPEPAGQQLAAQLRVIRHNQVCAKLQISSAKLFDMVATGLFPKPFLLIPGGRAVGWLEQDVDQWILGRKQALSMEAV